MYLCINILIFQNLYIGNTFPKREIVNYDIGYYNSLKECVMYQMEIT